LLNRPLVEEEKIVDLWNAAKVRVAVDGAATHWLNLVEKKRWTDRVKKPVPDLVTGDFDSIGEVTLQHYRAQNGCKVIATPDQHQTDFTKALAELSKLTYQFDHVVAFAEVGGRLDQILANVDTLFHAHRYLSASRPVYLASSSGISWLLHEGNHVIKVPKGNAAGNKVGLIPIGEPVKAVKTSGLKWDLDGVTELAFGSLVSTSNEFKSTAEEVTIENVQSPLLFTMSMRDI
jgi:thiamine pyrophosphokinase